MRSPYFANELNTESTSRWHGTGTFCTGKIQVQFGQGRKAIHYQSARIMNVYHHCYPFFDNSRPVLVHYPTLP